MLNDLIIQNNSMTDKSKFLRTMSEKKQTKTTTFTHKHWVSLSLILTEPLLYFV